MPNENFGTANVSGTEDDPINIIIIEVDGSNLVNFVLTTKTHMRVQKLVPVQTRLV